VLFLLRVSMVGNSTFSSPTFLVLACFFPPNILSFGFFF
jgi:hypothetical protein